jgi:hypothetical protein
MSTDPKLERYLESLAQCLRAIPVSDRAEIVTEIKSHVLDTLERDPSQSLQDVLSSLGEPENVANRFLLERGLKPGKPSKTPVVKWLTVGFLGTFGMILVFIMAVIWTFTPLIQVNEDKGSVRLLGGLINIADSKSKGKGKGWNLDLDLKSLADLNWGSGDYRKIKGDMSVDPKSHQQLSVDFNNGKLEIERGQEKTLHWECKFKGEGADPKIVSKGKGLSLDLSLFKGSSCELQVPAGLAMDLNGKNGKIEVSQATAALNVGLINGKISFTPDNNTPYTYEVHVDHGSRDDFESSSDRHAVPVKLSLQNGKIEQD